MKTLFACVAALLLVAASERPAQAAASVSVEFFYDSLSPYGDWVDVEGYGYCFRPTVTVSDPGWRPYSEGSWVYTDAGWTWDSDEDFGWATCHYGRWFLIGGTWFWKPGETWGPAWVSWRTGDDFIGWAPLPPEAVWQPETGFNVYVDVDYNIGPACYNFVPAHRFGELRLRKWLEPWQRNDDCMRATVNHTHITHRTTNNHVTAVFNEGPNLERLTRLSERGIRRMKLAEHEGIDITDPGTRLRNWSENDQLRVIAPLVQLRGNEGAPKLVRHRFDRSAVNRGWDGFSPESVEDLRAKADKLAKRDRSKDDRAPKAEPTTGPQQTPTTVSTITEATPATTGRDRERSKAKSTEGDTPTASAIQDPPPTAPREGEATSRPRPGEVDSATSKGRLLPESELRKIEPPTAPGRESDERTRIRPGDAEQLRRAVPVPGIPKDEKRLTPPERLRTEPQDAPPRNTEPRVRPERTQPGTLPPQRVTPQQQQEIKPLPPSSVDEAKNVPDEAQKKDRRP